MKALPIQSTMKQKKGQVEGRELGEAEETGFEKNCGSKIIIYTTNQKHWIS